MNLDNFYLAPYNGGNMEHRNIFLKLWNDKAGKEYLGDLEYNIKTIRQTKKEDSRNEFYIAYYGDQQNNYRPVGFIALTTMNNDFEITSGIIPEFRHQHMAALLLEDFTEKIFESYSDIDELTLRIKDSNVPSKKTAQLVGYVKRDREKYTLRR